MYQENSLQKLEINENIINKWQKIISLLASLFEVPSALIMRINNNKIEVFIKNEDKSNPYTIGESMVLDNSGLYCENVIKTQKMLFVKNALKNTKWNKNPDIQVNMINYLGFPITNREGEYFGTICVLDSKEKEYTQTQIDLLNQFKIIIEDDLNQIISYKHMINIEKMAALGQLVAGIAHEINTPLGITVTGITHLEEISNNLEKKFNDNKMSIEDFSSFINTNKELIALIYSNLIKVDSLIKSFKQISIDQSSLQKREFNLKDYLEEILLSLSNIVKKTNVNIEIICDEDINIFADAGSFSQIINNLIINSISHAFTKKEKGEISIKCIKNENNILINYSDNGKGIKEENIKKIFEPFFTTNRKNGGTGLGLHIIHNIITQAYKGSISCKSEKNKGVKFQIILNNI